MDPVLFPKTKSEKLKKKIHVELCNLRKKIRKRYPILGMVYKLLCSACRLRSFPTKILHIYFDAGCTTNCSERISASTLNCHRL